MKSASTNAINHAVACLTAGALTPCLSTAQIALPGDLDPAGRVHTQIVARVGELGSNSPPIAGLTVYVVSENGHRVTLRTNMAGTAATWLARARYRIVTTWRPDDGSSGKILKDGHVVRTLVRDSVAISATMIRSDDLMWADVTISNRSNRRLDVDPQTFTLNELSPKQTPLRYRRPTDNSNSIARRARIGAKPPDIFNRAPTANTLMPGQGINGAVFFERDEKAREVVLRIPLSRVTFEVPLSIR